MLCVTAPDWRHAASCRDADPELFYGAADSAPHAPLFAWERRALRVCSTCPVVSACLAEALTYSADEQHGVCGGMTASQRRVLLAQAGRRERPAA